MQMEGIMQKIIYRGFDVIADKKTGKQDKSQRIYRGVTFMPTDRMVRCRKSGTQQTLYRGVVSA